MSKGEFIFWLSLLFAIMNGTAVVGEISAISSDNLVPDRVVYIEWPCGFTDEICWWNTSTGETGP